MSAAGPMGMALGGPGMGVGVRDRDWEARERDRHADMMRLHGRMSKSAATSPVSTPFFSSGPAAFAGKRNHRLSMGEEGYFAAAAAGSGGWDHDPYGEREEEDEGIYVRRARRASGSWGNPEPLSMHHSLAAAAAAVGAHPLDSHPPAHMHERDNHAVHPHRELTHSSRRHSHGHIHASHSNTRSQPYPPPSSIIPRHASSSTLDDPSSLGIHHHNHIHRENDSPSPISTDGDLSTTHHSSLHPTNFRDSHSPHHPSHTGHPGAGAYNGGGPGSTYFTPSTSPFLGPLGALNIHSTQPSRAPSPIAMLPRSVSSISVPALGGGLGGGLASPVEEGYPGGGGGGGGVGGVGAGGMEAARKRRSMGDELDAYG